MNHRTPRTLCCILALMTATAASSAWAQVVKDEVKAFTEPNKRSQMNFREIGVVKTVAVKEGQAVKKGDVLLVLDKEIDEAELERLNLEAKSTARMEFSKADRDVKKAVYDRESEKPGAFNPAEIEQAKLDWDRAEAQIKVVKEDQQGAELKVKQQAAKIERMTLRAEFDGVIESIKVKEGELTSVDTDKPAIIVVQRDPLRVVITPLMATQVAKLDLGEIMQVRYDGEADWLPAKVIYKTPFADHASGTQTVWLELPNPEQKDAGRRVFVKVPEKLLSDGNGIASAPK